MPLSEILNEPDIVSETPYVESTACTLKVHIVKSSKAKAGFYYLYFSRLLRVKNHSIPTAIPTYNIVP